MSVICRCPLIYGLHMLQAIELVAEASLSILVHKNGQ